MSLLPSRGELDRVGGDGEGGDGADDADQQKGEDVPLEKGVIFHNSHPGWDKQQGHVLLEKTDKTLNLFLADPTKEQEEKEEDHADNAGGEGKGKQMNDSLSHKADKEDERCL